MSIAINPAPQPAVNMAAVAAFMDEMAVQMDESATTLSASPLSAIAGKAYALTISGMQERAEQIRGVTREFRLSGDMASFNTACQLAGCHPDPVQFEAFQARFH